MTTHNRLMDEYPPSLTSILEKVLANDPRFDVSYHDILTIFASDARVLAATGEDVSLDNETAQGQYLRLQQMQAVRRRALAAATLHLQPEDYTIVTGEHIYPEKIMSLIQPKPVLETYKLWGYATEEAMRNTTKGDSLGFVSQFLSRTGISLEQLVELIRPPHGELYFGKRLVITDPDGRVPPLTAELSDLRLWELYPAAERKSDHQPLAEGLCRQLQSFIRLHKKCGLPVWELDLAIRCLARDRVKSFRGDVISPELVSDLADVARLSQLTGKSVFDILPLWRDIGSYNDIGVREGSIYHKLFLRPSAIAMMGGDHDIFTYAKDGEYLTEPSPFHRHMMLFSVNFRLTANDADSLFEAAKISQSDDMTLGRISSLYRHNLLREMLGIPPGDLAAVLQCLLRTGDIFATPGKTLKMVKAWRELSENDWSVSDILNAINPSTGGNITLSRDEIRSFARSANGVFSSPGSSAPITLDDLVDMASYRKLRDSSARTETSLADLLDSLSTQPPTQMDSLVTSLSAATRWAKDLLKEVLLCKYPNMLAEQISKRLLRLDELVSLEQIIDTVRRIGPKVSVSLLFEMATPEVPLP
ncbi:hypothetical protein B0H63DRAFT_490092 [Podospora didyma]|uniref:Uncharacterized protein n=1 Tax=Podospora didyma TaxID=330526 RepID=A0AAE0K1R9_9PEZI|nr:hypothetical protein B0H63DRAFT_490092 [Podospora didyma]